MGTECYRLRSQILCADSPKVLRLKSKQRSLVRIRMNLMKKDESQTDGDTNVKDPVTCRPCQSSMDYGNTQINQHMLKVSDSEFSDQ